MARTPSSIGPFLSIALLACGGTDDATVDEPTGSACGEPTYGIEITFLNGRVERPNGMPIASATVELEDRQLAPPTVRGNATTDGGGEFSLDATEITSWPDCWLTLLDYQLVAQVTDGTNTYEGELPVNRYMWNSIQDGTYQVDLAGKPIVVDLAGAADNVPNGSACGTPEYGIELDFRGTVLFEDGTPVADQEIFLEDRQLLPAKRLGAGVTDAEGGFRFRATDITSWPNCWLTLLDYRLVAVRDGRRAELEVNIDMWHAIQDGGAVVDLSDKPLEVNGTAP
jgi:hypothetical protein